MQRVWRKTPCFDLPWSSCLTKIHHSIPFWKHCQCTPRQQCKPEYLFGFPINWFEILVMLITWDGKDYEVKAGAGELQDTGQHAKRRLPKIFKIKDPFNPAFNKEKIIVADFCCSGREVHHGHEQSAHVFSLVINPGVFINFLLPGCCCCWADGVVTEAVCHICCWPHRGLP